MAGEQFKEGDTVQLKSGGPVMTVESLGMYNGELKCACVWFEGSKQNQGIFKPVMLMEFK